MILYILLFFIIIFVYIYLTNRSVENLKFYDHDRDNYGESYMGFCYPNVSEDEFKTGNYKTKCWNNYSHEDCQLLNKNGFNCGYHIPTKTFLPCMHNTDNCHNKAICNDSCYQSGNNCDDPIFLKIDYKKLILNDMID
jgi:hypothetical protein